MNPTPHSMFKHCVTRDDEPKSQNTLIMKDLRRRYVFDLSGLMSSHSTEDVQQEDEPNEMPSK